MLKALELHGFKSFADKTRFEFPAGITVVVGPNGSGKSNIVDCIKWVLGEQSAKSLRGKDMADVIFKGSGGAGRKPMNTAEATLVFENEDRRLPIDAPEVHVTRRVYRSGEGEYLINRQPTRLKDIKDLFRGTGLGGDAYSLIEQGKVDKLLQASAKERRAIFEEAAGISRFKAKKVEAQRRLERVEQNLLRLSDIVEEVENRLKTVRGQASKARRYREYTDRLQQLRTQIALVDWQRLTEKLSSIEAELAQVQEGTRSSDAEVQRLEASHLELETAALTAGEALRHCENQIAAVGQRIASEQGTIDHERSRAAELDEEAELHRQNLLAMSEKAGDVRSRQKATEKELALAEEARQRAAEELGSTGARLAELARRHESARQQLETRRREHLSLLQRAAALTSDVETAQTRLTAASQAVEQHQQQLADIATTQARLADQLAAVTEQEQTIDSERTGLAERIELAENELTAARNMHASRADDLAQLHGRRQGVAERTSVLEEFERTLEGIGAGVRELLERAGIRQETGNSRQGTEREALHPWSLVRGVVADFVQADVAHAAAIDVALGDGAQAIVVAGDEKQTRMVVAAAAGQVSGRVAVLPLTAEERVTPLELTVEMVQGVGVVGRADKLVECPDEYRPMIVALLGRTFIVRTLDDAVSLRSRLPLSARFVTLNGELVDEHGGVAFGPRQSGTTLVSRRSQLRAAHLDLAVIDQQIVDAQRETAHLKREIERHQAALDELHESRRALAQQAAAIAGELQALAQQRDLLGRQQSLHEGALGRAKASCTALEATLAAANHELQEAKQAAEDLQTCLAEDDAMSGRLELERNEAAASATSAKVELARCEQRLEGLRLRMAQFEDDSRERERAVGQVQQQLQQAQHRSAASQAAMLTASAAIAELVLQQESQTLQMHEWLSQRNAAVAQRAAAAEALSAARTQTLKLREKEHQLSLAAEQVRHERRTLADRLREDYGIELAEVTHEPSPEEARERAAVEEEIEGLRRKIQQIGAVNLDALNELDDLEKRFATLSSQYNDLTEAKQSLERIIHKINADSRRLFLETLEAIRVNFQALYRKAFGGGKADILLEEGVDVLECGVEIVATPPGKPSFNNSLLSGGEKALTAVALLLAIFQFRPSPFCILDEVDAPFDEANIGRFIDVLRDFLAWTRFVIVTHSKKTMTAATTLYGITMQESGVSKRVSVRFDDVTEDGHIRREALERAAAEATAENAA
jgi:chromosome segregation protein